MQHNTRYHRTRQRNEIYELDPLQQENFKANNKADSYNNQPLRWEPPLLETIATQSDGTGTKKMILLKPSKKKKKNTVSNTATIAALPTQTQTPNMRKENKAQQMPTLAKAEQHMETFAYTSPMEIQTLHQADNKTKQNPLHKTDRSRQKTQKTNHEPLPPIQKRKETVDHQNGYKNRPDCKHKTHMDTPAMKDTTMQESTQTSHQQKFYGG